VGRVAKAGVAVAVARFAAFFFCAPVFYWYEIPAFNGCAYAGCLPLTGSSPPTLVYRSLSCELGVGLGFLYANNAEVWENSWLGFYSGCGKLTVMPPA